MVLKYGSGADFGDTHVKTQITSLKFHFINTVATVSFTSSSLSTSLSRCV